jgi:hypothetical protein
MQPRISKALALLGGVATLALGTSYVMRGAASKPRVLLAPCAPRLLALDQAVCEPTAPRRAGAPLAELSLHAPN